MRGPVPYLRLATDSLDPTEDFLDALASSDTWPENATYALGISFCCCEVIDREIVYAVHMMGSPQVVEKHRFNLCECLF